MFIAVLSLGAASAGVSANGQDKTAVCVACHGADGNSVNPIWPSLAGQHPEYIVTQLKAFKSGAREDPSMSPMAAPLDESDMIEIADFYAAKALQVKSVDDADLGRAEQLYRAGDPALGIPACMACHGPDGAGNGPAEFPAVHGQQPAYTELQLKAYRDGTRDTDPQAMMRTIAARLSDADIEQLARYLSALH